MFGHNLISSELSPAPPSAMGSIAFETDGDFGVDQPSEKFWGHGASGHEMALNKEGCANIIMVEPPTADICKICDRGLSKAMEPVVVAGSYEGCVAFLKEAAPDLCDYDIIVEHMAHGVPPDQRNALMVQNLMTQSYNMARNLGKDYATRFVTKSGRMVVANKQNINGFATAAGVFVKLLKCKDGLTKNSSSN